ncbi:DUF2889 domain-containing protein [Fusibacter ferrireducens]|uniref:DUF2889 domain-containing protein n=1 Tax=Fusibacter ferrireducens TaxID=2785058 RepID=A0ABR9ZZC3_9FIRM|nr:DUF2889 domain-containing protein [Fusibacter ferrireducens]MBF4695810.1 DUF2889 domain-containing protein [Fusibacter ferrireducens]
MEKVTSRNFKVDYYEKEHEKWLVKTQLADDDHEIEVQVEVDMRAMTLTDAEITFKRYPLEHCRMVERLASKMIGTKIDSNFSRQMMTLFMGAKGCPNIMSLLNISIPGIIYYYYPHMIKTGKISYEQWENMVRTDLKNDCIAHTMLG